MEFRIADTFTASILRLTAQEQKAVKTTAFDLQLDPSAPGLQFHRIHRSKDPHFWSLRVNADVRLIVHKTEASLLLCYADHHDAAYAWAERRRIERHPRTGAAQLVEVRERVEEIVLRTAAPQPAAAKPPLFADVPDETLLSYGVPAEWLADVRSVTEDTLFDVAPHLPQEAAEALLNLATGATPEPSAPAPAEADPFRHPDAERRFRLLTDAAELQRALDAPWESWAVFLHPSQRRLVERRFAGPAQVSGSAGTGKTVVALHRAVFLARTNPDARVLLTTFNPALAAALRARLHHLVGNEPQIATRIVVQPLGDIARDLYARQFGPARLVGPAELRALLQDAAAEVKDQRFAPNFLFGEWSETVDAWQLKSWEAYRDAARLGRRTRLGARQRELAWQVFARVQAERDRRGLITEADLFGRLTDHLRNGGAPAFDLAVVDEAQDLGVPQLRFLAALGAGRPETLFFAGDLGQRIFQAPFSWKSLGIDLRGRSHTLRINYRTSHQIRLHADRLLPGAISDLDGSTESRRGTVSVFDGPAPEVSIATDETDEQRQVGAWITARLKEGVAAEEMGVFVRAAPQLPRALQAVQAAGVSATELTGLAGPAPGSVAISTMHLAKGLEFRAVAVMACDDAVIPLQERIEDVADEADLQEVYDTERHLLYVACTRARDRLLVSGVDPASEFLDDFRPGA